MSVLGVDLPFSKSKFLIYTYISLGFCYYTAFRTLSHSWDSWRSEKEKNVFDHKLTIFVHNYSKIITAADDTMMKVHTVQPEGADMPLAESEPIDLDGEIFTICSNQVDTIAIGGEDKKAYLQKVEYVEEDGTIKLVEPIEKEIAMCFDTPVMKLQFCAGGKLLGVSQDTHV